MKVRTLTVTLAACAAFGMAGAGVASAAPAGADATAAAPAKAHVASAPWKFAGTFPTKAACHKKGKSMQKAGKIKDHRCWIAKRGYALAVHYR